MRDKMEQDEKEAKIYQKVEDKIFDDKIKQEARGILNSKKKLKSLLTEVFWRNIGVDLDLEQVEEIQKAYGKEIKIGLDNVAFHVKELIEDAKY